MRTYHCSLWSLCFIEWESQAIITMVTLLLDALSRRGGMEGREAQLLDALRGRGGRERGKPQLLEA